ncbi:hypothetical protein BD410DRAFT_630958 [Rickenella mellea]|uniref:Uncharacterized protein n=1 Tax=Rickenella mellea TaxID=50990 RepID=A0A4Y7QDA9_9AGAM|nr:hypothetical protein BD410DRAFT_630958 [Rickenella mellea]
MQASSSRPMSHNNSFSSSRTMASDSFKPKFPLDPFADMQKPVASREPWTLDVDVLPPLALSRQQRNVIMVIGGVFTLILCPLSS